MHTHVFLSDERRVYTREATIMTATTTTTTRGPTERIRQGEIRAVNLGIQKPTRYLALPVF